MEDFLLQYKETIISILVLMLPILIQILKQKGYNIDINKTYNGIVKSYTDVKNQVDVIKQESETRNTYYAESQETIIFLKKTISSLEQRCKQLEKANTTLNETLNDIKKIKKVLGIYE